MEAIQVSLALLVTLNQSICVGELEKLEHSSVTSFPD